MQKVLILGAKGLLGFELVEQFKNGYEVIEWDREEVDLTDCETAAKGVLALKPDILINSTAYNGVDLAESDATTYDLAQRINTLAVENLAKVCKRLDIPMVHFSTEFVFDGKNKDGYTEDVMPNPINKYGMTKEWGEKMLISNTDKYYLVRLSRMFGKPALSVRGKKSFVDLMIDLALVQKKTEVKLVDEEISCPTYNKDLAKVVYDLVKGNKPYGIYHAANEGGCSWYEFGKKVFELKGIDIKVIPVKSADFVRPAKRPLFSILINTKLPKQRHWEEALKEYLK